MPFAPHPDLLPVLTSKVFIVTRATSGIGHYSAARLAQHGAHVYLCTRSAAKGSAAIDGIKKMYPDAHLDCLEMDHLSLASVVAAAEHFLSKETMLHGLVNNAGVMATPFEMTNDKYEAQWQTNYLAHWVFTERLLPLMLETSRSLPPLSVRVVNVSSVGHRSAPKDGIHFADTSLPNEAAMTRYGQSKLANILHIRTLNRLYGPGSPSATAGKGEIWTAVVHPGLVDTNLGVAGTEIPGTMRVIAKLGSMIGLSADGDKGFWTSVACVAGLNVTVEQSGKYFMRALEPVGESALAKDANLASKLDEWTRSKMKQGGWTE